MLISNNQNHFSGNTNSRKKVITETFLVTCKTKYLKLCLPHTRSSFRGGKKSYRMGRIGFSSGSMGWARLSPPPPPHPLILGPNWGQKGPKKIYFETPPHLRDWMTAPLPPPAPAITPKKMSYGNPRKWTWNFTKLHLVQEIFRILPVFSQFLWNLTFIFSASHEKVSLVLLQITNYIYSPWKM